MPSHPQSQSIINKWLIIELKYLVNTLYLVPLALSNLSIRVLAGMQPIVVKSNLSFPKSRSE